VLADDRVILLHRDDFTIRAGTNIVGEPRDDVTVAGRGIPVGRVLPVPGDPAVSVPAFRNRAALGRAALMAGAARRALELSVAYAGEREQFGRPLARFQAIQQHVAAMTGEAVLCQVAVDAAALAVDAGDDATVPVAAAKAAAGQAAGLVCTWRVRSTARSASPRSTRCVTPPPACGPGVTRGATTTNGRRHSGAARWPRARMASGPY
jgi:acyl-CoA dehydrogenase